METFINESFGAKESLEQNVKFTYLVDFIYRLQIKDYAGSDPLQ